MCRAGVVCGGGWRRHYTPGPKPRLVARGLLGESDLFGPGGGAGGVGYSKQSRSKAEASKMFVELVVNDSTPGPGSVRDPPTSGGRGWQYAIARA